MRALIDLPELAGSVAGMTAVDGITLSIGAEPVPSETILTAIAPHALVLTTTLPDHGMTLTSTYTGHPATGTHATHLELAPGLERLHTRDHDHDSLPLTHARERCLLDHAATLHEFTAAHVDVADVALQLASRAN